MDRRYPAGKLTGQTTSLLLLGVTAATCSRATFALFDDPEGPNLVVVTGLTIIIYLASLAAYFSRIAPGLLGSRRIIATVAVQILVAAAIYLALR